MKDFDWFEPWMPLSSVPIAAAKVGDGIYQISRSAFISVAKHNREFVEGEDSPYVTSIIFAPSVGAVERSGLGELACDTLEALDFSDVPDLGISDWSYAAVSKLYGLYESAGYDRNGKFRQVTLESRKLTICFRERILKGHHMPYVVRCKNRNISID